MDYTTNIFPYNIQLKFKKLFSELSSLENIFLKKKNRNKKYHFLDKNKFVHTSEWKKFNFWRKMNLYALLGGE